MFPNMYDHRFEYGIGDPTSPSRSYCLIYEDVPRERSSTVERGSYLSILERSLLNNSNSLPKRNVYLSILSGSPLFQKSMPRSTAQLMKEPFAVLGATHLRDDFYTQHLAGTRQGYTACACGDAVYIERDAQKYCIKSKKGATDVTAVEWVRGGTTVAIGDKAGRLSAYEFSDSQCSIRAFPHAEGAINAIESDGEDSFFVGYNSGKMRHVDVRTSAVRDALPHNKGIITIKKQKSSHYLVVSSRGGSVKIFDERKSDVLFELRGIASDCKAIAWHPDRSGELVVGSGLSDAKIRHIELFSSPEVVSEVDADGQVCGLLWEDPDVIISTMGFDTAEKIQRWSIGARSLLRQEVVHGDLYARFLSPIALEGKDGERPFAVVNTHVTVGKTSFEGAVSFFKYIVTPKLSHEERLFRRGLSDLMY